MKNKEEKMNKCICEKLSKIKITANIGGVPDTDAKTLLTRLSKRDIKFILDEIYESMNGG